MLDIVVFVGAISILAASGCSTLVDAHRRPHAQPAVSTLPAVSTSTPQKKPSRGHDQPAAQLAALVSDTTAATGVSHATRDDFGHPLDTLKVIDGPRGLALGIYHFEEPGGLFTMAIATSSDLKKWTFRTVLATHASQPTMARLVDGAYVVVAEADDHGLVDRPSRWVRFWHYRSLDALLGRRADRTFDAPRTLGGPRHGAEGTPNLYAATPSMLRVGFHYLAAGRVDREGVGVLRNFAQWTTAPDTSLDAALIAAGARGKHGDRDCVSVEGRRLLVVEAQEDLGSDWQIYLYDRATERARYLPITTAQTSTAFANPSVTVLRRPEGRVIVTTLFLPSSGAAPGEAGELVRYRTLPSGISVGSCA